MEETLSINGKTFISSKKASELTGYTRDYVGQLAREGRIDSRKIGRARFIDKDQLLQYFYSQNGDAEKSQLKKQKAKKKKSTKTKDSKKTKSQVKPKGQKTKEKIDYLDDESFDAVETKREVSVQESESKESDVKDSVVIDKGTERNIPVASPYTQVLPNDSLKRKVSALVIALMVVFGPYFFMETDVELNHVRGAVEHTASIAQRTPGYLQQHLQDSIQSLSDTRDVLAAVEVSGLLESIAENTYRNMQALFRSFQKEESALVQEGDGRERSTPLSKEDDESQSTSTPTTTPLQSNGVAIEAPPRIIERIIERTSTSAVTRSELNLRLSNVAEDIQEGDRRIESLISQVEEEVERVHFISGKQDQNIREDIHASIAKSINTQTLSVSGNTALDVDTFFVDSEKNRVGIGTQDPGALLDVAGLFTVSTDGSVSITSSSGDLDVGGGLSIDGSATTTGSITSFTSLTAPFLSATSTTATSTFSGDLSVDGQSIFSDNLSVTGTLSAYTLLTTPYITATSTTATSTFAGGINVNNGSFVYDHSTGNIGIGTESPQSKFVITSNDLTSNSTDTFVVDSPTNDSTTSVAHFKNSDNSSLFYLRSDGKLGIGTTDPGDYTVNIDTGSLRVGGDRLFFSEERGFIYSDTFNDIGIVMDGSTDIANSAFYFDNLGKFGIGTTSPSKTLSVVGDTLLNGDLTVMGDSLTLGNSTSDTLTINSAITSDIIPDSNATYDLGSTSFYWDDAYVDALTVNNISAASTTIAGTASETFTINSDNSSADGEDATIIFYRGTVTPNALLRWDASEDTFNLTQDLLIQDETPTTGSTKVVIQGGASQSDDFLRILSNGADTYFNVDSSGQVGIGTTTPDYPLDVNGDFRVGEAGSTNALFVDATNKRAGIGTNSPSDALEVVLSANRRGINVSATSGSGANSQPALWFSDEVGNEIGALYGNAADDSIRIYSGGTDAVVINSSGNVGIGTTTPDSLLNVYGASPLINIATNGTGIPEIQFTDNGTDEFSLYYDTGSNSFKFVEGGVGAHVTILDGGNVGIGTTSPAGKFAVAAPSADTPSVFVDMKDNQSVGSLFTQGTNNYLKLTTTNSSEAITIGNTSTNPETYILGGNVGIGTESPSGDLHVGDGSSTSANLVLQGHNGADPRLTFQNTAGSTMGVIGYDHSDSQNKLHFASTAVTTGQVLTIDFSSGNVGIATTSPNAKLSIEQTGAIAPLLLDQTAQQQVSGLRIRTNRGDVGSVDDNWDIFTNGDDTLRFSYLQSTNTSYPNLGSGFSHVLVLDGSSERVGIGTTSIDYKLEVAGADNRDIIAATGGSGIGRASLGLDATGDGLFSVYNSSGTQTISLRSDSNNSFINAGNVGIGTDSPSSPLHVLGSGGTKVSSYGSTITVNSASSEQYVAEYVGNNTSFAGFIVRGNSASTVPFIQLENKASDIISVTLDSGDNDLHIREGNASATPWITFQSGGNVGIGETAPGSKLSVSGGGTFGSGYDTTAAPTNGLLVEGNVGIGTESAGSILDVNGTLTARTRLDMSGLSLLIWGSDAGGNNRVLSGAPNIESQDSAGLEIGTNSAAPLALYTNSGERMRIDSNGNVGIGTTSPLARLSVEGAGSSTGLAFAVSDTNDVSRFVIQDQGNVGIGTTSPTTLLHIESSNGGEMFSINDSGAASVTDANPFIRFEGDVNNLGFLGYNDSLSNHLALFNELDGDIRLGVNGSEAVRIQSGGNVGIGTTTPTKQLSVDSNTDTYALISSSNAGGVSVLQFTNSGDGTDEWQIGRAADGVFRLWHDAATKLEISTSDNLTYSGGEAYFTGGNVGIGTTGPGRLLDVAGIIGWDGAYSGEVGWLSSTDTSNAAIFATTDLALYTNGGSTRAMHLEANGNVGIGETSPADVLHLKETSPFIVLDATGTDGRDWRIGSAAGGSSAGNGNFAIRDQDAGEWRMVIDTSGNVGIGTTSPYAKLSVVGETVSSHFTATSTTEDTNLHDTLYVDSSTGRVGVGTDDPQSALDINGTLTLQTSNIQFIPNQPASSHLTLKLDGSGRSFVTQIRDSDGVQDRFVIDSDKTYVTEDGGSFGVGTSSPFGLLSIEMNDNPYPVWIGDEGTSTPSFVINGAGNVGIGTTNPTEQLEITGNLKLPASPASATSGIIYLGSDRFIYSYPNKSSTFVGTIAGNLTMTGDFNSGFGRGTLSQNTTGEFNTAVGRIALASNTQGTGNTAVGSSALTTNSTGSRNSVFGYNALSNNQTGSLNLALGYEAGSFSTQNDNIFIGYRAGNNLTSGSNNIILGHDVDLPFATGSNQLNIGNLIFANGVDGTGTTLSTGNVGIGTTSPQAKLDVYGNAIISGTSRYINFDATEGSTGYGLRDNAGVMEFKDSGGSWTSFAGLSDERLKNREGDIGSLSALEKVRRLQGVRYSWKDTKSYGTQIEIGLIAQDVAEIVPEVVRQSGDYLAIRYGQLTALNIEAIKEIDKTIETLRVGDSEIDAILSASSTDLIPTDDAEGFFSRILSAMGAWIEDGILSFERLYAYEFDADTVRAREITASELLCVGETCVTEDELKALLEEDSITSGTQTTGGSSDTTDDSQESTDSDDTTTTTESDDTSSSTDDSSTTDTTDDTATSTDDGSTDDTTSSTDSTTDDTDTTSSDTSTSTDDTSTDDTTDTTDESTDTTSDSTTDTTDDTSTTDDGSTETSTDTSTSTDEV